MTRKDFIAEFRSEIDGWILDAAMEHRAGAQLSMHLRQLRARIEAKLGEMYDALQKPVPTNGTPPQPVRKP